MNINSNGSAAPQDMADLALAAAAGWPALDPAEVTPAAAAAEVPAELAAAPAAGYSLRVRHAGGDGTVEVLHGGELVIELPSFAAARRVGQLLAEQVPQPLVPDADADADLWDGPVPGCLCEDCEGLRDEREAAGEPVTGSADPAPAADHSAAWSAVAAAVTGGAPAPSSVAPGDGGLVVTVPVEEQVADWASRLGVDGLAAEVRRVRGQVVRTLRVAGAGVAVVCRTVVVTPPAVPVRVADVPLRSWAPQGRHLVLAGAL